VTDPNDDELDRWLSKDVELLPPAPGTFERVRTRARQRKARQALASAAALAVVVVGGAFAPAIISSLTSTGGGHQRGPESVAAGSAPATTAPSGTSHPTSPPQPASPPVSTAPQPSSSTPVKLTPSSLSQAGNRAKVADHLQPTSITFVSSQLGAVIGQAPAAGQCSDPATCTSMAGTDDYGQTWFGVSAPATGPPAGARGVSQLRFLNQDQGFAYGPELWVTQDGGLAWSRVRLPSGVRVTDLETVDGQVLAVWARCQGTGPDFAATCTQFSLETAAAGNASDVSGWHAVPGATGLRSSASSASAVLTLAAGPTTSPDSGTVYLLAPDGRLLSGGLAGQRLTAAGQVPAGCLPGLPQAGTGTPSEALLTYQSPNLYMVCSGSAQAVLYDSADGGRTWTRLHVVPGQGIVTSLAASSGGLIVIATTQDLLTTRDNGHTWNGAVLGQGFSYVGMTDQSRGVALPAGTSLGKVWITRDGGQTWRPSAVRSSR